MSIRLKLVILIKIFFSIQIFAQAENPWVFVQTQSASLNIKGCSVKILYPKLKPIHPELAVGTVKKVNKFLRKEFQNIKKYENESQCNRTPKKNQPAFYLDVKFDVKLNQAHLLSIYYYAVGYTAGAIHPDNDYRAYTFDLRDGNRLLFIDLFKKPSNYLSVLNKEIFLKLKEMDILSTEEEFSEVQKSIYDFYLTREHLTIINLYDIHVLQSVEVEIKYEKLKKVLNPEIFNLTNQQVR